MGDYTPKHKPGHAITFTASAAVTGGQQVEVTGDYEVPGFARLGEEQPRPGPREEEPDPHGVLPDSDTETSQLAGGVSYFFGQHGETGFFGLSIADFRSEYGLVEGAHEHQSGHEVHDAGEAEDGMRVELERRRYDLKAAATRPFGPFEGARAHLGLTSLVEAEPELTSVFALPVGQVAIVPAGDPLATRRRIRVRELAGRPLVVPPPALRTVVGIGGAA